MVEPYLYAACGCSIYQDPFFLPSRSCWEGSSVDCAIVPVKCTWAIICGLDSLANNMGFPDPRSLSVRKNDGYDMTGFLQRFYKTVDIWRRLIRGWPIIVDNLVPD